MVAVASCSTIPARVRTARTATWRNGSYPPGEQPGSVTPPYFPNVPSYLQRGSDASPAGTVVPV